VWLSDFGANALVMFDPRTEAFRSFPHDSPNASVRQILGRPGEIWGAESGADRLVVVRGAYGSRTFCPVPTLGERIVEHLTTNGASLDDGELAEALGVGRPAIAETCRQLEVKGLVIWNMAGGTRRVAAVPAAASPTQPDPVDPKSTATFPDHARRILSARWGTTLQRRQAVLPGGVAHPFELVSGNGRIVGDVVWLADRGRTVEAKSAAIAEAVLIVGHVTNADRRFLVLGEGWDVVSRWLTSYRLLLDGVELWFLDGDRLERLA